MTKAATAAGVLDAVPTTEPARPIAGPASGLCVSCVKTEDCTFIRNAGQAVLDCDEFSPAEPRSGARHLVLARVGPSGFSAEREAIEGAMGLCRACARHADCTYSRPEGGVWHCDEYR